MAKKGGPDWLDDEDLFADDDGDIFDEGDASEDVPTLSRGGAGGARPDKRGADKRGADEPGPRSEGRRGESPRDRGRGDDADDDVEKKPSLAARLAMKHAKRPGEQETLKSPLVLGLGGGALVLAIMAGTFYFIIGRDVVTKELIAVEEAVNEQRYSQAIKQLDEFIVRHGNDKYTEDAVLLRARIRIDAAVAGSVPDWPKGIEAVNQFRDDCRDYPKYTEQYPTLASYSERIATGSLVSAARVFDRKLLKVSEDSEARLNEFANPDDPPVEAYAEIKRLREVAIDAIRKYEATQATYQEIEGHLAAKRPIQALESRRRLLDRYPELASDRKLRDFLEQTLETERGLVRREDGGLKASAEDRPLPVPPPLSLTQHSRASVAETSDGRIIIGVAQGCLYGLDTVTGDPAWRRSIGLDTPFFPVEADGTQQGLLVYDTMHQELVHVNRNTGALIWRLPLAENVSGYPVVNSGIIYLPTLGNHLYKIEQQGGSVLARLTFSQPVYSPPVLTRDEEHLILTGNEAVSYTIGTRQFECQRVSFTKQKPGTIDAPLTRVDVPMMAMGELVLMIENDLVDGGAMMRVFDARKCEEGLPELAAMRLDGHVRDAPVLRGNELYVVCEGEQYNVFTVSDDLDKDPLTPITQPPSDSDYTGPVQMLPGPGGRFWSAGRELRQFHLEQDSLPEDDSVVIGAIAQPIQKIGPSLYLGRHQLSSNATVMIQYDGESLEGAWRTVLGGGLLAIMPLGADSALCLTRSGELYQVGAAALEGGGFLQRPAGSLEIPPGTTEPLRACVLPNNQIAVVRGGAEARFWLVNSAGKAGQEFPLEGSSVADPIPLAGGAVVALSSKLRLMGRSGAFVEDFIGTVEQQEQIQWSSLMPVDDEHILVLDRQGRLSRLQFRTSPAPHMQQIDTLEIGEFVDVPPVYTNGKVVLTDARGGVQLLNATGFARTAETTLDHPAVGTMFVAGDLVLIETSRGVLQCLDAANGLEKRWSMPLDGDHVTGTPRLDSGKLMLATMYGRVLLLDAASGEVSGSLALEQSLEHGPLQIGKYTVVGSIDGSLFRVESLLEGAE